MPGRELPRLQFRYLARRQPLKHFAEAEITYSGGMVDGVGRPTHQRLQLLFQVSRRGERDDFVRVRLSPTGCVMSAKQDNVMTLGGEIIGQSGSQPASREIGQAPNPVQRFVRRPCRDQEVHEPFRWAASQAPTVSGAPWLKNGSKPRTLRRLARRSRAGLALFNRSRTLANTFPQVSQFGAADRSFTFHFDFVHSG